MIEINGQEGEGGGQVLRTSLALSAITRQPIHLHNIRGGRGKPGLLRQHLTGLKAAAEICGAEVEGADLYSSEITFRPQAIKAGDFDFDIGSAGSVNLVFQTVLPMCLIAEGSSRVRVRGGTHNPASPNCDFLQRSFTHALKRFGLTIDLELIKHGFYPAGGGEAILNVTPATLSPAHFNALDQTGQLRLICRYAQTSLDEMKSLADLVDAELGETALPREFTEVESSGPGWVMMAQIDSAPLPQVFTVFQERKRGLSETAQALASEVKRWRDAHVCVDEHLADQLLIPMALARGGSFTTTQPSLHTLTNMEIIARFLPVSFNVEERGNDVVQISVVNDPSPSTL